MAPPRPARRRTGAAPPAASRPPLAPQAVPRAAPQAVERAVPRTVPTVASAVLLAVAALALTAGCAAPGGLRDHGAAAAVTPPPVPQPLWPDLATAPPPALPTTATGVSPQPPPQPVPDVTVPGQDLSTVDVRTLLAKDPGVSAQERRSLQECPDCEVRRPEYRDLTGDGRPELVVAVAAPAGPVVLHVYRLDGERLLPVLHVPVLKGFSATTVGTDLWLHEPTTVSARTSSHYRWDGVRLILAEQKVEGIGPVPAPSQAPVATPPQVMPPVADPAPGMPEPVPVVPGRRTAPEAGAVASPRPGTPVPTRTAGGSGVGR